MSLHVRRLAVGFGFICVLLLLSVALSCSQPSLQPPVAKVIPKTLIYGNDTIVDNYYWLRERGTPEVMAYLEAENKYTDSVMASTEAFQETLFSEMRGRMNEDDSDYPVLIDSFYYYSRTEKDKQYEIFCRKLKSLDAPEQILLDGNKLAEGHDYYSIGGQYVSPNHLFLAFTVDTTGSEHYAAYVRDLSTGMSTGDLIPDMDGHVVWANDNKTMFYTTLDEIERPDKLYRHILGHPIKNDVLVFEEKDKAFDVAVQKSTSREYIFIDIEAIGSSETHVIKADRPTDKPRLLRERQADVEYSVSHRGDTFYILTNLEAENFRIMTAPVDGSSPVDWKEYIPVRDSVLITDFAVFADYIALFERANGLEQVRLKNLVSGAERLISFPEEVFTIAGQDNVDLKSKYLRVSYESMITPRTIFDVDMASGELEKRKVYEVRGNYDTQHYITERIFATAPDGASVPMVLVYRKGVKKNGSNPLYLHGYGAYGINTDPNFSSIRLSLIDRGFVYVKAQVRGGSEMGRWWYEDGRMLHKKNTFTDFIACAEQLISDGYTSREKLVISGGSAGGLLIGAVVNMRPDLFHIAVADVPFVDIIHTMMDPTIPLTVNEYTEWGNPNDSEYYAYMKSYSPYDHVKAQAYPNMLITAGLNDPRVQYWEPAKWTAKLRAKKTDGNRLLLKVNMGAGHMGASGRYDFLREYAFEYAFILDVLDRIPKK